MDFNHPEIDWQNEDLPPRYRLFYETKCEKGLEQLVDFATHNKGNVLDLILTDSPEKVLSVEDYGKLSKSDHNMLLIEICADNNFEQDETFVYDWNRMDLDAFKTGLDDVNWEGEFANLNKEKSWSYLKVRIDNLVEQ